MRRSYLYVIFIFVFGLFSAEDIDVIDSDVKNFHRVSDELYRSAQPSSKEMKELEMKGIKSVINLRNMFSDHDEIKGTDLQEFFIPMKAKKTDYEDVLNTMAALRDAPKPMLIHCRRGSDRTGCMVAFYRIVFMNWSKEQALEEFRNPDLGYLESLFPNLVELIEKTDIEKLKVDLSKR